MDEDDKNKSGAPSATTSLFRSAALAARNRSTHGRIVLTSTWSAWVITIIACTMAGAMATVFAAGSLTRRATVDGHLVPAGGVLRVYAPRAGTILEKRVHDGQLIGKGDVLFVIASDTATASMGETQAAVIVSIQARRSSVEDQIERAQASDALELDRARQSVASLRQEARDLEALMAGQRQRVEMAELSLERLKQLRADGFVSEDVLLQKQETLLEQRNLLLTHQRAHTQLQRELAQQEATAEQLPIDQLAALDALKRQRSEIQEELTMAEERRGTLVRAYIDGVAGAVTTEVGQFVHPDRPLALILPPDAQLQAHLYVPSSAMGFVQTGEAVLMRYQSFPYQKYGLFPGRIVDISRAALSSRDVSESASSQSSVDTQPFYRVTVELDSQVVKAEGKPRVLLPGMLLQADIARDTRRLYEWAWDPVVRAFSD